MQFLTLLGTVQSIRIEVRHYLKESHFPLRTHNRPLNVNCSRRILHLHSWLHIHGGEMESGDPMMP